MQIIHRFEDFLFELFPAAKANRKDLNVLREELTKFYTYGPYKPKVTIENGWVTIDIDVPRIAAEESTYRKVLSLSDKRRFPEAKKLLNELIASNPTNSEYHRVYGQILSLEGNQDEAVNQLIDALRWDPKNTWALVMMGNIFGRDRNDIDTAVKYYEQALKVDPANAVAMNNIGATLMEQRKFQEARRFFEPTLAAKPHPNTYFALSIIDEAEGNLASAFDNAVRSVKLAGNSAEIYRTALEQALSLARKLQATGTAGSVVHDYVATLSQQFPETISLVPDSSIPTPAKLELAENYGRDEHIIRYKPSYPAVEYLQMYELVMLTLTSESRAAGTNKLFVASGTRKAAFIREIASTITKLKKSGFSEESIADFTSALFDGLNRQIYNTPFELYIHSYIYENYPDLRPWELLTLLAINNDSIKSVTEKKIVDSTPPAVLWKSKVYNLALALMLRDLFGVDTIADYKAKTSELKLATDIYHDHLENMKRHKPGDEYILVQRWANKLSLENNFSLVDESQYREAQKLSTQAASALEQSTVNIPQKEAATRKFDQSQKEVGTNMAVVMYMVGALQYFKDFPAEQIRKTATQIAMLGAHGIDPTKEGYKVDSIPDKVFTGHQLLAYYYVSWSLSNPESVPALGLPYAEEYKLALQMLARS